MRRKKNVEKLSTETGIINVARKDNLRKTVTTSSDLCLAFRLIIYYVKF